MHISGPRINSVFTVSGTAVFLVSPFLSIKNGPRKDYPFSNNTKTKW